MAAAAIFAMMYMVVGPEHFGLEVTGQPVKQAADFSNTEAIAIPLYTTHAYAFVLAAVLLLLGIVAAIALVLRRRPTTEVLYQDVDKQVKTLAEDRFRMVKMDAVVEKDVVSKEEEDK
jgi:NADH-quinone oxidoreductase subunit J